MLLHLPPEVLAQIFILLPLKSIISCTRVNRYIRNLISASVEIQYLVQRLLSEYVDNRYCSLLTNERLALLEKRNSSKKIDTQLRRTIKLPFRNSGIYDLTGGIYLLGDVTRRTLHYMHLPDKDNLPKDEEIEWKGKKVQMGHMIIDMGLSVYENDLLAVITIQPQDYVNGIPGRIFDIHLHLYQVSTALPHPEARRQIIPVTQMQVDWNRPGVGVEIVGNNLVLILAYGDGFHTPDDCMFIYDWKSGVLKMSLRAPHSSYSGLIFLTQDIFLTPNSKDGTLEYWRVPKTQSDAPSQPFFKLALPTLYPDESVGIDSIQCRAEPSPTTGFHYSTKPFHPDPHRAIAIFNIRIRSRESRTIPHFPHPIQIFCLFSLFVHRSSLVECLDRFRDFISDDEDSTPVPYDDWGVDVCRWLPADDFATQWITTTSGQKCALYAEVDRIPGETPEPITLLDFNQIEVARILAARGHSGSSSRSDESMSYGQQTDEAIEGNATVEIEDGDEDENWIDESDEEIVTDEGEKLDDYGHCFLKDVYGRLPFKKCETDPSFEYSGVLLDEQRLIGIRNDGREIVYFGE